MSLVYFPDSYKFYGTVSDKYRQVGNAVAPPMGKFLGLEIRKAMAKSVESKSTDEDEEETVQVSKFKISSLKKALDDFKNQAQHLFKAVEKF